ncbi:MAG: twin-arginine translocase subunit TatC [Candidatus Nitrosocaldus sp.]|nr:twin-arginine translocase subunit TatC [Candidatus Nitrosocaldus sp.]MCS7140757.1 twin-arginine translocase subunit TatC [Candidatus Nitrosocaldus sp.]MDW8275012.1 twin-arginine translocase subunit TatC [Candidatus Nitrosocaldus sp.]
MEERTVREHLDELRSRVVRIALAIIILSAVNLTVSIRWIEMDGVPLPIPYPYPDPLDSISIQVIHAMSEQLVPEHVELVQLAPGQAFFAQLQVAIMLASILAMPVVVREVTGFIGPALYDDEVMVVRRVTLPALALFASGCIFSYLVIVPFMLDFLYRYGDMLGVQTFLGIGEFINFVMQFIIAFGLSFLLPIAMWMASSAEIVDERFWRRNVRYAIVVIALFGALITPDGSGITMWFVALPLMALYALGMVVVELKDGRS